MFNPELEIGQILTNADVVRLFKCSNMGGMRRSKTTNTLVLISDYTKGLYHDKWIGGVLHYTGTGKNGDQDIHWSQNETLAGCRRNGVDVHLFEVIDAGEYIYCGRIELVSSPYQDTQPGENGISRKVWMFPIRPVPDNNVRKPSVFVFKDKEDYEERGKNVDLVYAKMLADTKKSSKKLSPSYAPSTTPIRKEPVAAPLSIVGKKVVHKTYGEGVVTSVVGQLMIVEFDLVGEKKIGYEVCLKNKLISII